MPYTIEPPAEEVTEVKLGAFNMRRANGRDRDAQGSLIAQGQLTVSAVLRRHANGVDGQDLEPIGTADVEGEIAVLAGTDAELAAAAASIYAEVDAGLKKLMAILGYIKGVLPRPTV